MRAEVLRIEHVSLLKDDVVFLDDFNLQIFKGEIIGMIPLDSLGMKEFLELLEQNKKVSIGKIYLEEVLINNYDYNRKDTNKIYLIEEKSKLVTGLSLAENVFVMRKGFKQYILNRDIFDMQVERLLAELDIVLNVDKQVKDLTPLERCVIELLKGITGGCSLVVLYELSSFLSLNELEVFYRLMNHYRSQGVAFLYIGNHHEELFRICDRVALLDNGRIIKVFPYEDLLDEKINPYIISFDLDDTRQAEIRNDVILTFDKIRTENLKELQASFYAGECVTILNLQNSALEEIAGLMTGTLYEDGGAIYFKEKPYLFEQRSKYLAQGIAVIDNNPIQKNLFMNQSYLENLCFLLDNRSGRFRLKHVRKSIIQEYGELAGTAIYEDDLISLSPKEIYTLVYARIHLFHPDIVFCLKPFANADMYLRKHILDLIQMLKTKGITVVILSVNLADALDVSDRLLILEEGQITKEYSKKDFHLFRHKL